MNNINNSSRTLLLAFNNVAASAINLYTGLDRILDSGVQVDRANLNLAKSAERVHDAQDNLNKVIAKFGVDSEAAIEAGKTLTLAQDTYTVSAERANLAADTQRRTMLQFAVSVVPTLISGIAAFNTVLGQSPKLAEALSSALLTIQANPIMLVVTAVAAVVSALIIAYEKCEWFRNGINALADGIVKDLNPATRDADSNIQRFGGSLAVHLLTTRKFQVAIEDLAQSQEDFVTTQEATTNALYDFAQETSLVTGLTSGLDEEIKRVTSTYNAAKKAIDDQIRSLELLTITEIGRDLAGRRESDTNLSIAATIATLRDEMASLDASYAKTTDQINAKVKAQEDEKRAQTTLAGLMDEYNLSLAKSSLALNAYASSFDEAFGSGRIQDALDVAKNFAAEFSISLDEAVRTLQDFQVSATDSFSNLSDAAKTYLTGQVQDTVAKFKDCAGGKLDALKKKVEDLGILEAINISMGRFPTTVTAPTVESAAANVQLLKRLLYVPTMAEGGVVTKPTFAMIGESGPEAIIPLNQGGVSTTLQITGPLLVVEGSVDKRTADYVITRMKDVLSNVIIEARSSGTSSTHKRIRLRV